MGERCDCEERVMSILIKGMKMPENCFECPWRCKVDPENLLCRISGEYFEETFSGTIQNRHKSCPLVPVPPHGRLGDLDALAESVITPGIFPPVVSSEVLVFLRNAPTIIPADPEEEATNV